MEVHSRAYNNINKIWRILRHNRLSLHKATEFPHKATDFPHKHSIIAAELKRNAAYFVLIRTSQFEEKEFIDFLRLEYGSESENFLKSNRIGPFFSAGTGTGRQTIYSYARFYCVNGGQEAVFFDSDIKSVMEGEIKRYNEALEGKCTPAGRMP